MGQKTGQKTEPRPEPKAEGSSISAALRMDHEQIEIYLERLMDGDITFTDFRRRFMKHMSLEEKAVLDIYEPLDQQDRNDASKLLMEHQELLQMLSIAESTLSSTGVLDFGQFLKVVERHKAFEDQEFYPRIDRIITDDEKKEMLRRIDEFSKADL